MVLALSMGVLDTAAAELVNPDTCPGWKGIAAFEIAAVLWFIKWFVGKGHLFAKSTLWKPRYNVQQVKTFKLIDTDTDGYLSRKELLAAHKKLGLTEHRARLLFDELDTDKSGSLSIDEVSDPNAAGDQ